MFIFIFILKRRKKHVYEYMSYVYVHTYILNKLMSVTPHSTQSECYFLTMYTIVDMSLTAFFFIQ